VTFLLGAGGFFSLLFVIPALNRWTTNNPFPTHKAAAIAVIAAIGFISAILLSGWGVDLDCVRYGARVC
jgi:hypothetical protein